MSVFLKSCWAMFTPFKEDSLPLVSTQYDLEACENSTDCENPTDCENSDSTDCIMLVCEIPEVSAYAYTQDHGPVPPPPLAP